MKSYYIINFLIFRIENEIIDKKIQMYKLQINIFEREKEKNSSINEKLAKIIQTKLLLYNEEESNKG